MDERVCSSLPPHYQQTQFGPEYFAYRMTCDATSKNFVHYSGRNYLVQYCRLETKCVACSHSPSSSVIRRQRASRVHSIDGGVTSRSKNGAWSRYRDVRCRRFLPSLPIHERFVKCPVGCSHGVHYARFDRFVGQSALSRLHDLQRKRQRLNA